MQLSEELTETIEALKNYTFLYNIYPSARVIQDILNVNDGTIKQRIYKLKSLGFIADPFDIHKIILKNYEIKHLDSVQPNIICYCCRKKVEKVYQRNFCRNCLKDSLGEMSLVIDSVRGK